MRVSTWAFIVLGVVILGLYIYIRALRGEIADIRQSTGTESPVPYDHSKNGPTFLDYLGQILSYGWKHLFSGDFTTP